MREMESRELMQTVAGLIEVNIDREVIERGK